MLTIPPSDKAMFDSAATRLMQTIASRHIFKLDAMTQGEAYRLQTFIQNAAISMYPEMADLGEMIFMAARLSCLREIEGVIARFERAA